MPQGPGCVCVTLRTAQQGWDILCQQQEQVISSLRCSDLPRHCVPSPAHPGCFSCRLSLWQALCSSTDTSVHMEQRAAAGWDTGAATSAPPAPTLPLLHTPAPPAHTLPLWDTPAALGHPKLSPFYSPPLKTSCVAAPLACKYDSEMNGRKEIY